MKKIVLLLLIGQYVFAQNITLKGKVSTSDGQAAEFVNVVIKGLAKGTVADENGRYVFNGRIIYGASELCGFEGSK
jgi:iron complex outermembrane receptor protein